MSKKNKRKKNKNLLSNTKALVNQEQNTRSTTLEWTWKLESELHCGSGISRAGYADHLIYLNHKDEPEISGDAVKGAIRMSAEQILAWLGHAQNYPDNKTAEPQNGLLKAVFGEHAQVRFEPAIYHHEKTPPLSIRSSTAIDAETGTAKNNTLRQNELLEAGGRFTSRCTIWGTQEEQERLSTFLSASIMATEQIGAKRGIGWGRVRASSDELKKCLSEKRIETLFASIQQSQEIPLPSEVTPSKPLSLQEAHTWYKIHLKIEEPLCISSTPEISNQIETENYIAASVLKGALQKAWQREGLSSENYLPWLAENTRWSPAVPVPNNINNPSIITPSSWFREKQETGFENSPHGIHDTLKSSLPEREKNGDIIQWKSIGPKWLNFQNEAEDKPQEVVVKKTTTMHVARDYLTGSKRKGALYSRTHIAPDTSFVAYAKLPENVTFPTTIYLGKRNSAGHGKASLSIKTLNDEKITWASNGVKPQGTTLLIQLLSPLLYRDPKNGYFKQSLSIEDWKSICGVRPQKVEGFTQCNTQHAWLNTWKHPRTPLTAIQSGSVWKLNFETHEMAKQAADALAEHSLKGLGEQTHQGYGWFVINAPWLSQQHGQPAEASKPEKPASGEPAKLWPGCSKQVTITQLEELLRRVKELKLPNERRIKGPLQDLISRIRQKEADPQDVIKHCETMATRNSKRCKTDAQKQSNPKDCAGAWAFLKPKKEVYAFLKDTAEQGADSLRFALEMLLIEAEQGVSK